MRLLAEIPSFVTFGVLLSLLPALDAAFNHIQALDKNINLLNGRFQLNATSGVATCDWSGATIEFTVTGTTSVMALLDGSSQWAVILDGQFFSVVQAHNPPAHGVRIASGLDKRSPHTLRLVKMNEGMCGPVSFAGVVLDDSLAKLLPSPPLPTRKLAFLGDSITCGYGVLGTAPCPGYNCGAPPNATVNHTNWESAYWSYASVLGRKFKADAQNVCRSGAGFAHGWDKHPPPSDNLDQLFSRILSSDPNSIMDPSSWVPDAVVINVGTNDMGIPHNSTSSIWVQTYLTFLRKWRKIWPDTVFFLGCFPMLNNPGDDPALVLVAEAFADNKTHLLSFDQLHANYGRGCYGHPNVTGHALMAQLTGRVLSEVLGWN
jgi:lysophospholipase L1-like esterase